jgi:hypothetical protein
MSKDQVQDAERRGAEAAECVVKNDAGYEATGKGKRKTQRIKLRMYKHPVKLDATIVAMAADGRWLDVEFDGPLQGKRLYRHSEHFLTNEDPRSTGNIMPRMPEELWEVC